MYPRAHRGRQVVHVFDVLLVALVVKDPTLVRFVSWQQFSDVVLRSNSPHGPIPAQSAPPWAGAGLVQVRKRRRCFGRLQPKGGGSVVVVVVVAVVPVVPARVDVEGLGLQIKPLPVFLSHVPTRTSKPQQTLSSHGAQVVTFWYVSPRQLRGSTGAPTEAAAQSGAAAVSISKVHPDHSDHCEYPPGTGGGGGGGGGG